MGDTDADIQIFELHIASGVARLSPEDVIEIFESDSEEDVTVTKTSIPPHAKDDKEDQLTHPMEKLLKIKDEEFTEDDERLLKLMSLAIQNGAPPNLVKLYQQGFLNKSHVLTFIRTSIKGRKPIEIDISGVDFSHGHLESDPIILISPSSNGTTTFKNEQDTKVTMAAASQDSALLTDPPSELRNNGKAIEKQISNDRDEFKPRSTVNGAMSLKSFKDFSE